MSKARYTSYVLLEYSHIPDAFHTCEWLAYPHSHFADALKYHKLTSQITDLHVAPSLLAEPGACTFWTNKPYGEPTVLIVEKPGKVDFVDQRAIVAYTKTAVEKTASETLLKFIATTSSTDVPKQTKLRVFAWMFPPLFDYLKGLFNE